MRTNLPLDALPLIFPYNSKIDHWRGNIKNRSLPDQIRQLSLLIMPPAGKQWKIFRERNDDMIRRA